MPPANRLCYGDCLDVLRDMPAESVDLIYLDPPFNSKRDYNAFFKPAKDAEAAQAQIVAFEDTWKWGKQTQKEYNELLKNPHAGALGEKLLPSLREFLDTSDMMAYLVMMASRLVELRRVLKPTGSLYLHCDPTASHYLKIILDGIFGPENFKTEISWRRSSAHNDAKQGRKQYGNVRDTIFFYTKGKEWTWNWQYTPYSKEYIANFYNRTDANGRKFRLSDMVSPKKGYPTLEYELLGVTRTWRWSKDRMMRELEAGRIYQAKPGNVPQYIRYLDEMPGVPVQNDWDDLSNVQGAESLGYPTQKPLALLERIIATSSNPGDVVLDPFCGCGTAIHAAQKLGRKWIGIDITHLAIALIKQRIKHAFPRSRFTIEGTPKDLESARYLAESNGLNGRYQFQYWALSLINAIPSQDKKKGADSGIDGILWAYDSPKEDAQPFKIVISVKSGGIPANHIRELQGMIKGKVKMAFLITLEKPSRKMIADALAAGEYEYPGGKKFPAVQIFTIEELLNGKQPDYLDYGDGKAMPKQAKREADDSNAQGKLI